MLLGQFHQDSVAPPAAVNATPKTTKNHCSCTLEVQLMVAVCRRVDLLVMDMDSREKELGGIAPWELKGHRVDAVLYMGLRGVQRGLNESLTKELVV